MREDIDRSRSGSATSIDPFRGREESFDQEEECVVYADGLVLRLGDEREVCFGDMEFPSGDRSGGIQAGGSSN